MAEGSKVEEVVDDEMVSLSPQSYLLWSSPPLTPLTEPSTDYLTNIIYILFWLLFIARVGWGRGGDRPWRCKYL